MLQPAIITTVRHNVGDDFVREGILYLLESLQGPSSPLLIHKHLPATTRPEFDWFQTSGLAAKLATVRPNLPWRISSAVERLPIRKSTDKIFTGDLLIQSGAPIFWLNSAGSCVQSEWWGPLIERRWLQRPNRPPFLNLAGGTCQPYHSDGSEFASHPEIIEFARNFHDIATLTTARDPLTAQIFELAGRSTPVVPCTSIFAIDRLKIVPKAGEYFALNYMPGAGHFPLGQPIDPTGWEAMFVRIVKQISQRHPCLLVCHNGAELRAAQSLLPNIPTFYSEDYADYLTCYARAIGGLVNRVHAGFALASLGKPVAIVGSDTRTRMASLIEIPHGFVNDISDAWLQEQVDWVLNSAPAVSLRMAEIKSAARSAYLDLLADVFDGNPAFPMVAARG